jgi:hypothetical protein
MQESTPTFPSVDRNSLTYRQHSTSWKSMDNLKLEKSNDTEVDYLIY